MGIQNMLKNSLVQKQELSFCAHLAALQKNGRIWIQLPLSPHKRHHLSIAVGKSQQCGVWSHQLRKIEPFNASQGASTYKYLKKPSISVASMAV